ncbi:UNVERIFIED_CONTAM: hypothetical protein GTU68_045843 [Idotea baltica]|nr:hypothetical protein [Idotea baltica]
MDIERAIRLSAEAFDKNKLVYGHGTSDALAEASWLVLHALKLSPLQVPNYAQTLRNDEIEQCNDLVMRRINERVPAAYLTGTAWFAGHSFRADARALVPRSPLAEFILDDFFELINPQKVNSILDLCTGGGCIAIACAHQLSHAKVDASDLSSEALGLAAENVADHQLQQRVALVESSLFENLTNKYDLIISNPPYVDAQDINDMGDEFDHEPLMGLAAGVDGLDLVRLMLNQARDYLNEGGLLVVEVGNSAQALEDAYPDVPFLWLEFDNGGTGIFALTRSELEEHSEQIKAGLLS